MKKILFFGLSFFLFINFSMALTKAPVDVTKMSINDLLDAMDKGYLSSEMLVNIYLERIEAYNGTFNAINQINENALEEAKKLDEMRRNGEIKGKLHGIPIVVKSNIDVKGLSTNAGTLALNQNYPIDNSYVVQKLIDEGAIILGNCNMSALAFSAQTSYSYFGYVRNAFDESKTAYGSSGGSAVAVALSMAAASLGTDTNSSVRAPSSGAGLVGMRPTYGLVSHSGVIPYDFERDTVGVLSKTTSDNALLLSIISGYDENDETTKDALSKNYDLSNSSLVGKKIGVLTQYVLGSENESGVTGLTDPIIYELLEKSINELAESGAEIVYLDKFVKYSNLTIASSTQAGGTFCDYFNDYIKGTEGPITNFKEFAKAKGTVWDLSGYLKSCGSTILKKDERDVKKQVYESYVENYFSDYNLDIMLYPTVKSTVSDYKSNLNNIIPGNSISSVIGYPAMTIPMGKATDGLYYGLELMAQKYNEDVIYDIASSFEIVNNSKIEGSTLAPSLYEVPSIVTDLILLYEDNLDNNNIDVMEWKENVTKYFSDYNDLDDIETMAVELINIYPSSDNSFLDNIKNMDLRTKVYYSLILLIIICGIVILMGLSV